MLCARQENTQPAPGLKNNLLFIFPFIFIYLYRMGILPSCMSVHHVHTVPSEVSQGCQIPLELELLVVSHHLGAENQTQVFWKSNWYP